MQTLAVHLIVGITIACCLYAAPSAPAVQQFHTRDSVRTDTLYQLDKMTVRATKIGRSPTVTTGPVMEFTAGDIISTAGTAEDISRYIATLPSAVSSLGENFDNSLYVRGGRPTEVLFVIDGIEMESINHFSKASGSGGPVGFINSEFVKKVAFYAGNEPARFAPRLSSVVDVHMKSGSFTRKKTELGCKLTGGMFATEGPAGSAASYLVTGRYIDFKTLHFFMKEDAIPRLGDLLFKGKYLINESDDLSVTGLLSYNTLSLKYPLWERDDINGTTYRNRSEEKQRILQGGAGVTYTGVTGKLSHQLTWSASFRAGRDADSLYDYTDPFFTQRYLDNPYEEDRDSRYRTTVSSNTTLAISGKWDLSFGARAHYQYFSLLTNTTRSYSGAYTYCFSGIPYEGERNVHPRQRVMTIGAAEAGAFSEIHYKGNRWEARYGIRADYFRILGAAALSHRVQLQLPFIGNGSTHVAASVKPQFPVEMPSLLFYSLSWLQNKTDKESQKTMYSLLQQIQPLQCYQASVECDNRTCDWAFVKVGVFGKWYDREYHFISPRQQEVFYFDNSGAITLYPQDGKRKVFGLEGTLENSNRKVIRYTCAASLFTVKNRYRDGRWYDDWTNIGYTLSLQMSTSIFSNHQLSVTGQVNGGRPYCRESIVADCIGRKYTVFTPGADYYSSKFDKMVTVNARYGFLQHIGGFDTEFFIDVINMLDAQPTLEYRFNGESFIAVKPFGITPVAGVSLKW